MKNNGTKLKIDVAILQEKVDKIDQSVEQIMQNHLPHLHAKVESIDKKNAYFSGGLAALVFLLGVLMVVLKFFFK